MPSLMAGTGRGCRRGSQAWCSVLQIGIPPCLPAGAEASPNTRRPNGYGQSAQRSAAVHSSLSKYPDDLGECQLSGGAITRRTTVSRARCCPAAPRWANGKWRQKLPFWTPLAKDWLWSRAADFYHPAEQLLSSSMRGEPAAQRRAQLQNSCDFARAESSLYRPR